MPAVLKMARQINQASWLLRALFHRAISFQTPSQMARRTTTEMINTISEVFMFASINASRGVLIGFFVVFFLSNHLMKYPADFHCPSFSKANVTVSIADFLLANEVSNCMTTYCPSPAPGNSVIGCADFNWRDTSSPSGLRNVVMEFSQTASVTAPWKKAEACFQLSE